MSIETLWDYVDYTERHILKIKYLKYEKLVSSYLLFPDRLRQKREECLIKILVHKWQPM